MMDSNTLVAIICLVLCVGCTPAPKTAPQDNAPVFEAFTEDQRLRRQDWTKLSHEEQVAIYAGDEARKAVVLDELRADRLRTGADYYHAAMVLQHGRDPSDFLLAHELAMAGIVLGERRAAWLAAASLDRYLINTGRPQRFGTQYEGWNPATGQRSLSPVDKDGTYDSIRRVMDCPSLSEAAEKASQSGGAALKRPLPQE